MVLCCSVEVVLFSSLISPFSVVSRFLFLDDFWLNKVFWELLFLKMEF